SGASVCPSFIVASAPPSSGCCWCPLPTVPWCPLPTVDGPGALFRRSRPIGWGRFGPVVFDPSRQSEVGHQGLPPCIEEDVAGFEVAVDEALLVDVMDRTGDLGHEPGDLLLSLLDDLLLSGRCGGGILQTVLVNALVQATLLGQLHGEVEPTLVLADVIN